MSNELIQLMNDRFDQIEKKFLGIPNPNSGDINSGEWMTLNNGAKYADVCVNTFKKFRLMGLRVSQIDGVQRVSRKEIDNFLQQNSL